MNLGIIFMIIAVILFFLGGIGSTIIPNPVTWGLFALSLGLLAERWR
jgi:hypothetical protein